MYLETLYKEENKSIRKMAREYSTFNGFYEFWLEHLFERCMKLFIWENTYNVDTKEGIKPKEIEVRLFTSGHCGITDKYKNELTAFFGNYHGVSKYLDEKPFYTVHCPVYTGEFTVDKNIVVIDNTSLKNPLMPIVNHYAILLAHNDVTIVNMLVNARELGGTPIAQTQKQKQSIQEYQGKLFNGQYGVVLDAGMLGIEYGGINKGGNQDIKSLMEIREKLMKSFYSAIGVKSAFEKNNNAVVDEVRSNDALLQLNLSDMLSCRKEGAEKVNKMFGTNWTVRLADELNYNEENDVISSDQEEGVNNEDENS